MKFTTKLTLFIVTLISMTLFLVASNGILSIYISNNVVPQQMWHILALMFDQTLDEQAVNTVPQWLPQIMRANEILSLDIISSNKDAIHYHYESKMYTNFWGTFLAKQYATISLNQHADYRMVVEYIDPGISAIFSRQTLFIIAGMLIVLIVILTASLNWLAPRFKGIMALEARAHSILTGDRDRNQEKEHEWPKDASKALDLLLYERQKHNKERIHLDTLIRTFFSQDSKTGLLSRLSFDHQLTIQLESLNAYGVVMFLRFPDFESLYPSMSESACLDIQNVLITTLSSHMARHPTLLFARYFNHDFAVLAPHLSLKEADVIAAQLIQLLHSVTFNVEIDKQKLLYIGVSAYNSGQSLEQIIDYVLEATRSAELQGNNGWCVHHNDIAKTVLGSVRKRTLLQEAIETGNRLRFYEKPSMTKTGILHHRALTVRLFDGEHELLAAETKPWLQQFNLIIDFEKNIIARVFQYLTQLPEETFAVTLSISTLLNTEFMTWLTTELIQQYACCHHRLLLQFNEKEVAENSAALLTPFQQLKAHGCSVGIVEAGVNVVDTTYIQQLPFDIVKLHSGLVRNLAQRPENQLIIESLCGAYVSTSVYVFAAGVKDQHEWKLLCEKGIFGGQGILFAPYERLPI